MTRADLIAALEKAEGPDRKLDRVIFVLTHGREPWRSAFEQYEPSEHVPTYTASLDAALPLAPKGWAWEVKSSYWATDKRPAACVVSPDGGRRYALGATPAIALCIAALKARE